MLGKGVHKFMLRFLGLIGCKGRDQRSEIRDQGSGIRDQRSGCRVVGRGGEFCRIVNVIKSFLFLYVLRVGIEGEAGCAAGDARRRAWVGVFWRIAPD